MSKQYQIKTVQDMINCTNETNLENFLTDLKGLMQQAHMLRELAKLSGGNDDSLKLEDKGFTWIDDNENKITISIKPK
jgi:hypothetical protein